MEELLCRLINLKMTWWQHKSIWDYGFILQIGVKSVGKIRQFEQVYQGFPGVKEKPGHVSSPSQDLVDEIWVSFCDQAEGLRV